ncbi:hypothetical protein LBMAG53_32460 [Planctomycetota bacterium]|nr:hypothetical protein LBMAG53_32460 [Planctomycetota bacterium]
MTAVVVFDLGGVLYDFRGDALIAGHSRRRLDREQVQATWIPLVRGHESGQVSAEDFAALVIAEYDLTLTPEAFLVAFAEAAAGFYEGALDLVADCARRHTTASLSNIGCIQWTRVRAHLQPIDPFHAHHPSHEIGRHKPDPQAWAAVADVHGAGRRYLFLDDRPENVASARAAGWEAHQVRGVAAARAALVASGVL